MMRIALVLLGLIAVFVDQLHRANAANSPKERVLLAGDPSLSAKELTQKRRSGPMPVSPVTYAGVRYEVVHWGKGRGLPQNGGYIAAIDEKSGQQLWLLRVYEVHYDGDMEDDKQDIFITSLMLNEDGKRLSIEDEHGRHYLVDTASQTVFASPRN
jgi:hypothetical protein